MDRLCLGTFGSALKRVIKEPHTNVRVVELIFGLVTDNVEIVNQVGDTFTVTDANASDMLTCKIPVHREIKKAIGTKQIVDAAEDYVADVILSEIPDDTIDEFIQELCIIIAADSSIPNTKRDEFISKASIQTVKPFLAELILYALKKPNKEEFISKATPTNTEYESFLSDVASTTQSLKNIPRPIPIPVPTVVDEETEIGYVSALLDAYADAEGIGSLTSEQLAGYPTYKKNFDRQRKDYYAAESVRHSARDVFGEDNEAFDSLRSETYDGIIDVHSLDYSNGYQRLNTVLAHATTLSFPNCIIQKADWLGKSEQKGVCHILVNDGDLNGWVDTDE